MHAEWNKILAPYFIDHKIFFIFGVMENPAPTIIRLHLAEHEGKERMFAEFPRHAAVIAAIRQIPGTRWSSSKKM
ncbi:MAG: hypothetical protein SH857_04200 [Chitinophagales bacterium]|nr:hypothetical protein [Chitinophagales bacterium]